VTEQNHHEQEDGSEEKAIESASQDLTPDEWSKGSAFAQASEHTEEQQNQDQDTTNRALPSSKRLQNGGHKELRRAPRASARALKQFISDQQWSHADYAGNQAPLRVKRVALLER
jgi:hypothetical protein